MPGRPAAPQGPERRLGDVLRSGERPGRAVVVLCTECEFEARLGADETAPVCGKCGSEAFRVVG